MSGGDSRGWRLLVFDMPEPLPLFRPALPQVGVVPGQKRGIILLLCPALPQVGVVPGQKLLAISDPIR